MRVVVVVLVVVLAVAVVSAEVLTRAKKYHLCTARDVSMLVAELCSGTIGGPLRGGLHRSAPGNAGIMTVRSSPHAVRGRRREEDGPPLESLPLWEKLNQQKYGREELDRMDDLLPAWDLQDVTSYEDQLPEPGWLGEAGANLPLPLVRLAGTVRGADSGGQRQRGASLAPALTHMLRGKRQTLSTLRARCCRDGCDEAELYTFCV